MSIEMKNGSIVEDSRFGRLVKFDDRSRNFPITAIVKAKLPRAYTWRCRLQLDQGNVGMCVGCGVTAELAAWPAEAKGLDLDFAKKLYWAAQMIDEWPGGSYPGARPFYEGTSILAGTKIGQQWGWFDEYRWAFGLDDLILGVSYNGPAVIGVNWYTGMLDADSKGYIHPTGKKMGGHCVLVRGVYPKTSSFLIHNSWGANWGKNGMCYIKFDDMRRLLKEDGEAVFFVKRHQTPKPANE